ncbi:DgyrCDS13986 [Dimorphilus gyrociliatus]|uniref:DgyrCDS13986 n=1 Tax=Dimorphilus gyrociliatus TaxID=2664684 RepID=A0A7I8WCA8_9ANNE|nr:DgyrCDS13986 [Dimorphilus gyrociliatus]
MAAQKRKQKGKTVPLTEFLGDNTPSFSKNWADEVAELDTDDGSNYGAPFSIDKSILPTAPKATREPVLNLEKVPTQPPFTAFVGNLSYEVNEDSLQKVFSALKVKNVRLISEQGRFKGYGYVEFEDRDSLIKVLSKNDELFLGRKMRVDLATGGKDNDQMKRNDRGDRGHGNFNRDSTDDRTLGEWRKGGSELPPAPSGGGFRDRGRGFQGSSDLAYSAVTGYQDIRYADKGKDDIDSRRSSGGFRNDDRRDSDRGRRGFSSNFGSRDNRESTRQRREDDRSDFRQPPPEKPVEPAERPRLKLQPRTKSTETPTEVTRPSSIFGEAKPVDTAAKEREIEDKLVREREQQEAKEGIRRSNERRDSNGRRERRFSSGSSRGGSRPGSGSDMRVRAILRRPTSSTSSLCGAAKHGSSISSVISETDTAPGKIRDLRSRAPPSNSRVNSVSEGENDVFEHTKDKDAGALESSPDQKRQIVPAPAPKENAWTQRRKQVEVSVVTGVQTTISDSTVERKESLSRPPTSDEQSPSRRNKSSTTPSARKGSSGRGKQPIDDQSFPPKEGLKNQARPPVKGGRGAKRDKRGAPGGPGGKTDRQKKPEKSLPKSVEDMPKYEESKAKDFRDTNKFSSLMEDDDNDNMSADSDNEDNVQNVEE